MIDGVRGLGVHFAQGIIRQFGQMNTGIKPLYVFQLHLADILNDLCAETSIAIVKRTCTVETSVQTDDFVAAFDQVGSHETAYISIRSCDEYFHR